jgi:hypothetical protein
MKLAMNTLVGWILVTGLGLGTLHAESPLWVYVSANFQVDRSTDGVTGYMYTTWRGKYDDLEAFAELVQAK